MKVCGIDPGYERLGVAVLEDAHVLYSTCIETKRSDTLSERLASLGRELESVLKEYSPDTLAIETLFFSKNKKTALSVAHARGVILYLAEILNIPVVEYSPQSIKIAVTGHGAADKVQVISMLHKLLTLPDTETKRLDDEYDALAVALTHSVSVSPHS